MCGHQNREGITQLGFKISQTKKDVGTYCCAYGCTSDPVKKKGGLCHKHYARKLRCTDPVYARYNQFKNNAAKRNRNFTITLPQFRDFCHRTGYLLIKGKRGRNATVDRIDNRYGYHIDNIQLLTNMQNVRKQHEEDLPYEEACPF